MNIKLFSSRWFHSVWRVTVATFSNTAGSSRLWTKARLLIVALSLIIAPVFASVYSQEINLKVNNTSLERVLKEIRKQSGYNFFLNADVLKSARPVSVTINRMELPKALEEIFKDQPLEAEIANRSILIKKKPNLKPSPSTRTERVQGTVQEYFVRGKVVNELGQPLAGVTVKVVESGITTSTNEQGQFEIDMTEKDKRLAFSYIGLEPLTVEIDKTKFVDVVMLAESNEMDDIVVTGFFNQRKESFTGSSMTFTGEKLKAVAPTSVIEALTMLTPGLTALESKATGSDPNRLPDILLRGVTSFTNQDQSVNLPLIVRDGTIVSLQDLYDMDINEIASITVLKDASAAALYGAKAANGVIVIERTKIAEGKLKIAYNFIGSVQFPDFSDYKLLNGERKLEYERLAGLYESSDPIEQYALDSLYNNRFKQVRSGVNTDWMAQPSRVGATQDHSLRLSGGSSGTRYEFNTRFADVKGVMKEDYRKRYGLGFVLEHYAPFGLSFTNRTSYSRIDVQETPYGAFSNYVRMNPYDPIKDPFGEYYSVLSWDLDNPLYEASLGSFDRNSAQVLSNDFDARWNINNKFRFTTHWNITLNDKGTEKYVSPLSGQFRNETDLSRKGSITHYNDKGISYSGNAVFTYNNFFSDGSLLSANLGGNINKEDIRTNAFRGIGIYSNELSFIDFVTSYPSGEKPSGSQTLSTDVGAFLNMNYSFRDRYYVDGVYQLSGSSKFGANNRFGHFWSSGLGWNLHNEEFINEEVFNLLKVRSSMGFTGKVSFSPYQALTTYQFNNNLSYLNGIGAVPITIGNPDLTWERTMNYNVGLDVSLFNRRFNLTADMYLRKTTDLLIDMTVAPSTGTTSGKENLGEMENRGVEVHLDGYVIYGNPFSLQVGANLMHNRNKILKISNALEQQNQANNEINSLAPLPQFQEGESTTALKVVQSAGIDPATGQEIYIKRNGDRTFEYDPVDKVVVGDQLPSLSGNFFLNARYKSFSAAAYFGFTYGGYIYNTTRASKVEGADPKYNADERVFTGRWQNPGDIAQYKDIRDQSMPRQTSRFVEKENTLNLQRFNIAYDFDSSLAKRIRASKVSVGLSMNDLFRVSTVKIERGTSYLYSRGVDLNLIVLF